VGIGRAHRYGLRFQQYVQAANDEIAVIVQAEHIEAVKNIESIVKVPGVDAILIGPYDLSASMGKMGQVTDPDVLKVIERGRTATLAAGLRLGFFGVDAAAVKSFIPKGFTLITVGTEVIFLAKAAREALTALKP
jgi:2-keto-3-deoxy-L-rhamnonate aldolase RhmA